ncbi:MAG TPA: signal peptidase I [Oceanithermus profundus]|uniref:Signal peptidase I n=1 Tax=Oceanithermus profundus TaxID=187137 RepID=A0A7C4V7D4_9DEIN|nr:signal peptidase I [Oceanithermus profundus]
MKPSEFMRYLWDEWFRQVGEALLVAFVVTTFFFTTVQVYGRSMVPTLQHGERVLVPKYEMWMQRFGLRDWRRGEIVIVKPPEGAPNSVANFPVLGFRYRPYFIKRLVARPGDTVQVEKGRLVVNGVYVDESYITDELEPYPDSFPRVFVLEGRVVGFQGYRVEQLPAYLRPALEMLEPVPPEVARASQTRPVEYVGALRLAPGYYFVMGDNRTLGGSEDSRVFGPVTDTHIAGRASAVWWPPLARDESGAWRLNLRRLPVPPGFLQVPESAPN